VAGMTIQALKSLRREGMAALLSVTGADEISIPLEALILNPSITLTGLSEGASNPQMFIPRLVQYYKDGRLPVDRIVKFYEFKDIETAFKDSHKGKTVKPVLLF
jgi:aryl-alcohol dehydrogenase